MEKTQCPSCSQTTLADIRDCVRQFGREQGNLIPILHSLQSRNGYLTAEALEEVAVWLDIPASEVYGTATFYTLFAVKQHGEHVIRLCDSPPCHIEGATSIKKAIEAHLGVSEGETTDDGTFTIEAVSCIGLCGVAPAIMIDEDVYGNLTPEMIAAILGKYQREEN